MKKKYILFVMLSSISTANAQTGNSEIEKKKELKLNVLVPFIGAVEATYERN